MLLFIALFKWFRRCIMHAQELNFLDRLERGELKPSKLTEVLLATPRILDVVKHDDPELLDALSLNFVQMSGEQSLIKYYAAVQFYAAANDTTPINVDAQIDLLKELTPNPHDLRDTYWHLLQKIHRLAQEHNATKVMGWLLEQYNDPLYPVFTEREATRRHNARDKKFYSSWSDYNKDKKPLPRRSKDSVYDNIHGIFRSAIRQGDRALMLKAIETMQGPYKYFHHKDKRGSDGQCTSFYIGKLDIPEGIEDPVTYLEGTLALIDEADSLLGTKGTKNLYIQTYLVPALASDNPDIRNFFIEHACALPKEDKRAILEDRNFLGLHGDKDEDIEFRSQNIFFNRNTDALNRFLDVLDDWDSQDKRANFRKKFLNSFRDRFVRDYGDDESGVFNAYTIQSDFDSPLDWNEVTRRLNILTEVSGKGTKPVDLANKEYFCIAITRALEYGHSDDLKHCIEFAQSQDKIEDSVNPDGNLKERKTYMELVRWQIRTSKISRDKGTLSVLKDYLAERPEEESRRHVGLRLLRHLSWIPYRDDRHYDAKCSFFENGVKIPEDNYADTIPIVMDIFKAELDKLSDEEDKTTLIEELFGGLEESSFEYESIAETLKIIGKTGNYPALISIAEVWYDIVHKHCNEDKRDEILRAMSRAASDGWKSSEDPSNVKAFIETIKARNPEEAYKAINSFGHVFSMTSEDIYKPMALMRMFPEIVSEEDKEELEASPTFAVVNKRFNFIENNRTLWTQAGLELPDVDAVLFPPTNFDPQLHEALLKPMQYYSEIENNKSAAFHAFKLATLFSTLNKASKYLHNHAQGTEAVHDACLFALPQEGTWDKELWSNLAVRWGNGALRWLSFAPQLEAAVEAMNQGKHRRDHFKLSECKPAEIRALVHEHCSYKNKDKNPELAEILLDNGVDEKYFDETFAMLENFERHKDKMNERKLPVLALDGALFGLDDYALETLPQGDYRNLWMGQFVNCCAHLANQGRTMAIAMFQEPDAAAYVIKKKDGGIVAAMHSWLSKQGNLVFNSWQPKTADFDFLRDHFVTAAANQALEKAPNIKRVVLGQGRLDKDKTPYEYIEGNLFFDRIAEKGGEVNVHGQHYTGDTQVGQFIVATQDDDGSVTNADVPDIN